MLLELHIENLAVIEALTLEFGPGFTAVTGETGAGKSLLVTALGLVAGARGSGTLIRQGADRCLVEARLRLDDPELLAHLDDQGYGDEPELLVRRMLVRDGNGRVYLNGRLAPVQLLRELLGPRIEIHAQHAQQRLLEPERQLELLDRCGGVAAEREAVAAAWRRWRELLAERERLADKAGDRDRELDYLRYQLERFAAVDPQPGELETLEEERRRLRSELDLAVTAGTLRELLADTEGSALDRLYSAEARLAELGEVGAPLRERLGEATAIVEEVNRALRRFPAEPDPETLVELERIEARLARLHELARRFGGSLEAALAERERLLGQVAELEALEERLSELERSIAAAEASYLEAAADLSEARRIAGERLAEAVTAILPELELPHARLEVAGLGAGRPGPTGRDRIEFQFTANPGEPAQPLRRIASGGELSRVLLALQGTLGGDGAAVIVFDEVDTGIGGEAALAVGERLRRLGAAAQVLAVTHTPQVAAHAHAQLHVTKEVRGGRTHTRAKLLTHDERERELARMLGDERGEAARAHARTLLETAAGKEPVR